MSSGSKLCCSDNQHQLSTYLNKTCCTLASHWCVHPLSKGSHDNGSSVVALCGAISCIEMANHSNFDKILRCLLLHTGQCLQTALDAVAPGGRIVLVGLGAEKCCVPTMQTVFKEIDFMGSFRYTNTVSLPAFLLQTQSKLRCYDRHWLRPTHKNCHSCVLL